MNKLYIKKIKKILDKNTFYENKNMGDSPTPYIITNEKDYIKLMKYLDKLLGGKK